MRQPWKFIWDFCDDFYSFTGFRIQAPIEWFYPQFSPWLFGKMIGVKGVLKENSNDKI